MKMIQRLLLQALKASLENNSVQWEMKLQSQDWLDLFKMAEQHHILPMIYEAVFRCPAAQDAGQQIFAHYKINTLQTVMLQTIKTAEFLSLFANLKASGISPCVVKGIVCRSLYPNPDYRISGDEDILIPPEQFRCCHDAMLAFGMTLSTPERDPEAAFEVPYSKIGSPLYIELHKILFPPDSEAYGDLNRFFDGVHERLVEVQVQGSSVFTMAHTDHLFYLICHAFKHFLHSGFGIRQVCDIVLFANAYGQQIAWNRVLENCREIHADLFAAALFQIGGKYLTFDPDRACYPDIWKRIQVDETAMLEDLLDSGIYGGSNMSRKHSSNVTLNAVSAQKQGKWGGNRVLKTVFPPAKALEQRYPYLKEKLYLLPVAWVSRIAQYGKETRNSTSPGNNAADAIKIGNERVELMKQYGILGNLDQKK